jgi:microcystin-dependent protein
MSDYFVGEIRIVPFNFAPVGWAMCNGQLLPISQNQALFALMGTYYGGDGVSNFALPNLQGSAPLNMGQGSGLSPYVLGQTGGSATVTLLQNQIPAHNHPVYGSGAVNGNGDFNNPANYTWARPHLGKTPINIYNSTSGTVPMNPAAFATAGGSQPHDNMPPYLTLNFIIAMTGVFPSRQ